MTGSAPTCCLTKSHISDTVRMKIFFCFSLQALNELTPIVGKAVSHCHKLHICWDCWLGLYFSGSIHFTLFKKLLFLNQFCNGFPFFISMPNNKYILTLAGEHLALFSAVFEFANRCLLKLPDYSCSYLVFPVLYLIIFLQGRCLQGCSYMADCFRLHVEHAMHFLSFKTPKPDLIRNCEICVSRYFPFWTNVVFWLLCINLRDECK